MKQTEINILFNSFSATNTKGLLTSIQEQLRAFPSAAYSVIVNIIFNGNANDLENINELIYNYGANANLVNSDSILSLEKKYQGFINEANCLLNTESVQRGRIQQQIYIIENYCRFKNTIVWQVDDDMLFNSCNIVSNKLVLNNSLDFFGIVVQLYENQKNLVDAFVAKSNYTPPVPALLYTLNQLTDILINKFKSKDVEYSEDYHDYYFSSIDEGHYNIKLHENENLPSLIKRILNGQPITRPVLHKQINEVGNEPCFLRGGNFIVFNTEMFLNIPHLGFVLNDHEPARRSDMLHSTLAIDMGYSIVENHQLVLVHNRSFAGRGLWWGIYDNNGTPVDAGLENNCWETFVINNNVQDYWDADNGSAQIYQASLHPSQYETLIQSTAHHIVTRFRNTTLPIIKAIVKQ